VFAAEQAVLPGRGGWWALVVVAVGLVSVAVWLRSTNRSRLTVMAGWLAIGLASGCVGFDYAASRAEQRLAWALPVDQESREIVVDG
jgi:competence protein ComEC